MSVFGRTPLRQFLIVAASVAILAAVAASAFGEGKPTGAGNAAIGSGTVVTSCCINGSIPGLTATGQSDVRGQGTAARDAAITRAVTDATDQAKTAAAAAGITLGAVIDLEISTPPVPYPLMGGASVGSAPSPTIVPVPYPSYVSVTITWAIG
jgi:hypothetical protein